VITAEKNTSCWSLKAKTFVLQESGLCNSWRPEEPKLFKQEIQTQLTNQRWNKDSAVRDPVRQEACEFLRSSVPSRKKRVRCFMGLSQAFSLGSPRWSSSWLACWSLQSSHCEELEA
jgi:hypothetical protein